MRYQLPRLHILGKVGLMLWSNDTQNFNGSESSNRALVNLLKRNVGLPGDGIFVQFIEFRVFRYLPKIFSPRLIYLLHVMSGF